MGGCLCIWMCVGVHLDRCVWGGEGVGVCAFGCMCVCVGGGVGVWAVFVHLGGCVCT